MLSQQLSNKFSHMFFSHHVEYLLAGGFPSGGNLRCQIREAERKISKQQARNNIQFGAVSDGSLWLSKLSLALYIWHLICHKCEHTNYSLVVSSDCTWANMFDPKCHKMCMKGENTTYFILFSLFETH